MNVPTPEMQGSAIIVWPWRDAPESLRALSTHGGDEDWIAPLPASYDEASKDSDYIPTWVQGGGTSSIEWHDEDPEVLEDGRLVFIGANS